MKDRLLHVFALLAFALAIVVPLRPTPAAAIQYPCTLQGVEQAITDGGDATFSCAAPTTITLTTLYVPTKTLSLDGGNRLTLQGQNAAGFAISAITVTLKNLTVQGFSLFADVGGNSALIVDGVLFQYNRIVGGSGGSAIHSTGDVTIRNSTFFSNTSSLNGGAVSVESPGSLAVSNSTFILNQGLAGGAVATTVGGRIENSVFISNTATPMTVAQGQEVNSRGGAIAIFTGTTTITGSRFQGNLAHATGGPGTQNGAVPAGSGMAEGGAIFSTIDAAGGVTITTSSFVANTASGRGSTGTSGGLAQAKGGAIYHGNNGNPLVIESSTFAGNATDTRGSNWQPSSSGGGNGQSSGGAVFSYADRTLILNSTFFGNSAIGLSGANNLLGQYAGTAQGGAISAEGAANAHILFSTIISNFLQHNGVLGYSDGAGVYSIVGASHATLTGTILAGNTGGNGTSIASNCADNSLTWIVSGGFNLADDASCSLTETGDAPSISPVGLGPLQDNGGPSLTMAPIAGSPAINTAGVCTLSIDQRGVPRPRGAQCDKGAVEVGGPVLTSLSPTSAQAGGSAFQLQVSGSGFLSGTVGLWKGSPRTTNVVSATLLRLDIPASDISATGSATVTARYGSDPATTSNALTFSITSGTAPTATPTPPTPCPNCTPTASFRVHLPIVSDAIVSGW